MNEVTCSIEIECARRLSNLYQQSHTWLLQVAHKVTKNRESAEDQVSELYEWLHKKQNPKLWWGLDSYNLKYCSKFIKHRYINKTKKLNRTTYVSDINDTEMDIPYNVDRDIEIENAHIQVIQELKHLSTTKMWPSARIFELYWMSDDTLDDTAKKIGISKSTTFLAVKKVRKYLYEVINNPFDV